MNRVQSKKELRVLPNINSDELDGRTKTDDFLLLTFHRQDAHPHIMHRATMAELRLDDKKTGEVAQLYTSSASLCTPYVTVVLIIYSSGVSSTYTLCKNMIIFQPLQLL